jgi:hypothetical protein
MAISPFTILLEDDFVAFPLSTLLAGGAELKNHPLAGRWGKEGNETQPSSLGEEHLDGLLCIKVRIEFWHQAKRAKGEPSGGDFHIWLDVDRNYLPIKVERYSSQLNGLLKRPRPSGIGRVDSLREIEPGVWFPFKTADRFQLRKIVWCQHLPLDDRKIDLHLVQPTRMDRRMHLYDSLVTPTHKP